MEKATTKKEILERVKDMKLVEETARDSYIKDIQLFKDKKIIHSLEIIKKDEDKHINILESLIKLLEK